MVGWGQRWRMLWPVELSSPKASEGQGRDLLSDVGTQGHSHGPGGHSPCWGGFEGHPGDLL